MCTCPIQEVTGSGNKIALKGLVLELAEFTVAYKEI